MSRRSSTRSEDSKEITVTWEDDEGEEQVTILPSMFEVCNRCRGEGTHTNPSIDGNGITGSEMAELCNDDPDFEEDYFNGKYDVTCENCHGLRVERVVDEEAIERDPSLSKAYEAYCEQALDERRTDYEDAYTRRMESGGY